MKREIKFRAWDTKKNKMWSAEEMGRDELTINPDGRGFVNVSSVDPRLSQYPQHLIPLQFTGLRAEHGQGKEVYRSDIVRITMACGDVVIGEVTWDEDNFGWAVDIGPGFWDFGNIVMCHHLVEVIGNIHDNPGLLK